MSGADEVLLVRGERDGIPTDVRAAGRGEACVLAILDETDDDPEWAADTALAAAEAWAASGRRVLVADLHVDAPVLHERVGIENLEGLTDVFLYGASIARSARPVPDRSYYLVSGGTYVTDPSSILAHPRWAPLVEGVRDQGALLALYAPASAEADLRRAGWVDQWIRLRSGGPVRPPVPIPGDTDEPTARPETGEAPPAPPQVAQGPAEDLPTGEPAAGDRFPAGGAREDTVGVVAARTARRRRRGIRPHATFWILLLIFVLLGAAIAVFFLRPGALVPWGEARDVTRIDARGMEVVPPGVAPVSDPLPYSVEVRNFTSFDAARERIERDRERVEETTLFVSPILDRGVMYYRIFAGPAGDTIRAAALREALRTAGVVPTEAGAARADRIERTPYAYDLGVRANRPAADAAVDSLAGLHVPAYAVLVRYDDGIDRWRLYGGAYRDSLLAESMARILETAEIPADLVPRVGVVR